jgi:plasmid stabilization system protein ParE
MALKVKWSKYADQSFDRILAYLEAEWDEKATRAFVHRTHEFIDLLSEFPEIGSLENPERQIRGFVLIKQITVFYTRKEDVIILLNFYDNRRNPIFRIKKK